MVAQNCQEVELKIEDETKKTTHLSSLYQTFPAFTSCGNSGMY